MASPLSIAHVSPYPWEAQENEVNAHIRRVTSELSQRGHRVLIVAPSRSQERVRASRKALRSARTTPATLLEATDRGEPGVIAVGEVLDVPTGSRARARALPVDVARTIEELLSTVELDFVHVHEPFAPSTSSAALRHSRSLNVGSFHAPTEHLLSTQVGRRFVETFFGRLDARVASFDATAQLMQRHFPAEYRLVRPGVDSPPARAPAKTGAQAPATTGAKAPTKTDAPVRVVFVEHEERAALRVLVRALRHLHAQTPWEVTVLSERGESSAAPLRAALRERVRFLDPQEIPEAELLAQADVIVCGSEGIVPAPGPLLRALTAGVVPVASRLPVYEELLDEGARGLLFEPRDADTLAAQLARLIDDTALRARMRDAGLAYGRELTWKHTVDQLEEVYATVAARRHSPRGNAALRKRLARRQLIDVDLHMHTDHSHDCATPVEVLLATAREQGLGAIAVTDHNEVSGALEAREKAAESGAHPPVKVIVAEEVKTASQGEVIGLFIEEKIPRGLTLAETVAEIKRQGGLVYVPHPFDRMHSVPDYEHLLTILDDVDAIEVFNPRVAIGAFNEEAVRFAAKYRIIAGAGSDSHVAQGLGSVRIRMRDFDGPEEFLQSLRDADIITRPTSLLYVQALKFLETKATPAPARRARRARRVRRATEGGGRKP
ncbi:MAG TPA: glycosyltransferase [Solirubrobacteraceae bacterium]|nr:glycosyltransferase [Solirubrobacteraceae bacterium]